MTGISSIVPAETLQVRSTAPEALNGPARNHTLLWGWFTPQSTAPSPNGPVVVAGVENAHCHQRADHSA